jgi:AmiR/NasT family two-component response regulator
MPNADNCCALLSNALARTFASCASVAPANARVYWRAQRLAGQLEEAFATRGITERAKGIIAEQGCLADEAFQLLVPCLSAAT